MKKLLFFIISSLACIIIGCGSEVPNFESKEKKIQQACALENPIPITSHAVTTKARTPNTVRIYMDSSGSYPSNTMLYVDGNAIVPLGDSLISGKLYADISRYIASQGEVKIWVATTDGCRSSEKIAITLHQKCKTPPVITRLETDLSSTGYFFKLDVFGKGIVAGSYLQVFNDEYEYGDTSFWSGSKPNQLFTSFHQLSSHNNLAVKIITPTGCISKPVFFKRPE